MVDGLQQKLFLHKYNINSVKNCLANSIKNIFLENSIKNSIKNSRTKHYLGNFTKKKRSSQFYQEKLS